jgi:HD-GYP domain-containing protein (c-di-GMP phosphodiesterase class II)
MRHLAKKLSPTGVVILLFTIMVIVAVSYALSVLEQRYTEVLRQNVTAMKREHIADIVNNAHGTAITALKNIRAGYSQQIISHANTLSGILSGLPIEKQCQLINRYGEKNHHLTLLLQFNDNTVCQHHSAWTTNQKTELDNPLSIRHTLTLDHNTKLQLLYSEQAINSIIQAEIFKLFDGYTFGNRDIYLWINQIENFNGGDDYAIRIYHQNLPESVGTKLSTNITDIKGNKPYLTELNGINQSGEAYNEYYFKKRTNDEFIRKISFAKLFRPFNWVIASGIYVDDVEELINQESADIRREFMTALFILFAVIISLAITVYLLLGRLNRTHLLHNRKELELQHHKQDIENYRQVLFSMLDIIEKRDSYTAGHTRRVASYAVLVGQALKIEQSKLNILYEAAILHDIGKVSTPDTILLKPGRLTDDEYEVIKNHVQHSYDFLRRIPAFIEHAEIVRHHHERYDGQGYPCGLRGNDIPLLSHILIIVDAFDAMSSSRLYQQKKNLEDALTELSNLSGAQFSPEVLEVAVPALRKHGIIKSENDQLQDSLEKVRMAYYFQDSLTGLYNRSFLGHVLAQKEVPQCCYFMNVTGFSTFNKNHGWLAGDKKLIEISQKLKRIYPDGTLFRVFGCDFLIVHADHHNTIKEKLTQQLNLTEAGLGLKLFHLNLNSITTPTIDDIINAIEIFMYESLES